MKSRADKVREEVVKACEDPLLIAIGAMSSSPNQAAKTAERLGLTKEKIKRAKWVAYLKKNCLILFGKDFLMALGEIMKEKEKKIMIPMKIRQDIAMMALEELRFTVAWLMKPGIGLKAAQDPEFGVTLSGMHLMLKIYCRLLARKIILPPDQSYELTMNIMVIAHNQMDWPHEIVTFLHWWVGRDIISNFLAATSTYQIVDCSCGLTDCPGYKVVRI